MDQHVIFCILAKESCKCAISVDPEKHSLTETMWFPQHITFWQTNCETDKQEVFFNNS